MGAARAYCPECEHCRQAKDTAVTVASVRAKMRPWEFAHYGEKITGLVDWYDGWWVGINADDDNPVVPDQIIDKRQWVSGFLEGWKDAEQSRNMRAMADALLTPKPKNTRKAR